MEATAATAAAEAPKVRIPAVSVEMDREEDFYLSQRLAMARITGGPRSRQAIVRECVRRCMELDRRQAETSEPAE